MTPGAASGAVSAVVGGMAVGRLVVGALARTRSPLGLLSRSVSPSPRPAGCWSGCRPSPVAAVAGLLVVGLGVAGQYPLGAAMVMALSGGQPDRAIAVMGIGVGLASGIGPFARGRARRPARGADGIPGGPGAVRRRRGVRHRWPTLGPPDGRARDCAPILGRRSGALGSLLCCVSSKEPHDVAGTAAPRCHRLPGRRQPHRLHRRRSRPAVPRRRAVQVPGRRAERHLRRRDLRHAGLVGADRGRPDQGRRAAPEFWAANSASSLARADDEHLRDVGEPGRALRAAPRNSAPTTSRRPRWRSTSCAGC